MVLDTYHFPKTPDRKHDLYSCTKSISSTLIGIAIDKGYIPSVDLPLLGEPVGLLQPGTGHLTRSACGLGVGHGAPGWLAPTAGAISIPAGPGLQVVPALGGDA